jgi:NAD(P)-dependent dehydrogenase (short-subunit alcohol dehydrogenase family)
LPAAIQNSDKELEMNVDGSIALVTGANRGLGRVFARALLEQGARTVYGGARESSAIEDPDVVPLSLDVTDPASVAHAAEQLTEIDVVINKAGVATWGFPLDAQLENARRELEVNYPGLLSVAQAFAPALGKGGGGALVNMLSVSSFVASPRLSTYAASKAAAWSITNSLRIQLRRQGTLVIGVHAGFIDTEMAAALDDEKIPPEDVAAATMSAILAGREEVLVDELTRSLKSTLHRDQELIYPAVQRSYDAATQ